MNRVMQQLCGLLCEPYVNRKIRRWILLTLKTHVIRQTHKSRLLNRVMCRKRDFPVTRMMRMNRRTC
jgi:hypothetical protein